MTEPQEDTSPEQEKDLTNYLETLINHLKGIIGSGAFAMGFAFKNAGVVGGPLIFALIAILNVYCQHILLKVLRTIKEKHNVAVPPDYAETAYLSFSMSSSEKLKKHASTIKVMINVFLIMAQLGFSSVYIVFVSENFGQILHQHGCTLDVRLIICIFFIPMWSTSFLKNLKRIFIFSLIANILLAIALGICCYYMFKTIDIDMSERKLIAEPMELAIFFGPTLYSFVGICLTLTLKNEMKNPEKFDNVYGVLNVASIIECSILILFGFFSYLTFGEKIKGSVTLNLPKEEIAAQVAKMSIVISIVISYALQMYIPYAILFKLIEKKRGGPFKHDYLLRLGFRTSLVILTFIMALGIPFLGLFTSLVGAFCGCTLTFVFPPILEWAVAAEDNKKSVIVKDIVMLIFGIFCLLAATGITIYSIVQEAQKGSTTGYLDD